MFSLVNAVRDVSRSERAIMVVPSSRQCVGPYRLCIELASGGMASVYLARPQHGGKPSLVAVKIIHAHLAADSEFIQMFMDEAELASQIRHANVCSVFDYAGRDGEYYIAMEYLLGESLMSVWSRIARRKQVDRNHLSRCVARILADACEGLHAAHQLTDVNDESLEIVHRDVSPENVFVTYDGVAKVMDFGVASAARKRHRTQTGIVKGKFAYIAPECLRGAKPDRRADVWGIGVIAWELLTGQRLFRRETDLDTLQAVSEEPIPRPTQAQPDLPPEIDEIVMRALVRDPEGRYATARDLARDLARFAARGTDIVTSADVADWLEALVPGGRARRRQILELAKQIEGDNVESSYSPTERGSGPALATGPRPSPFLEQGPEPMNAATWVWPGSGSRPPPGGAPGPAPTMVSRRTRGFGVATVFVALGMALGGAAVYWAASRIRGIEGVANAVPGGQPEPPAHSVAAHGGEVWLRIRVEPETRLGTATTTTERAPERPAQALTATINAPSP